MLNVDQAIEHNLQRRKLTRKKKTKEFKHEAWVKIIIRIFIVEMKVKFERLTQK